MKHLKMYLIFIVTIVFLAACDIANKKSGAAYQIMLVNGSTKNKIEILDFGGTGQPILFLAGLGSSAHVFVDFAPKFCDKFHVYAMTRRGYGVSEQTANGYRIDTLAKDILAVTQALNFDKVILIGHSIAGDEVSKFASTYPDKVDKVIYLDAAYDHTNLMTKLIPYFPAFPKATAKDSSSFDNYKAYSTKLMGVNLPDEDLKATTVFSKDGKYQKDVTPGEIEGKIMAGIETPNYKNINCSALSIYSIYDKIYNIFPFYDSLDLGDKRKADTLLNLYTDIASEHREVFKKEVKKGIVKEINGANHCVFISNAVETEKLIREFLY